MLEHLGAILRMLAPLIAAVGLLGHPSETPISEEQAPSRTDSRSANSSILGLRAGEERKVGRMELCWCPPGRFLMGSPPDEPERRADETQVEITLTKGFWVGKYEVTQRPWKRVVGDLPGKLTAGAGDDFPVYNVNYAEAKEFCRKLVAQARAAGDLPAGWEFRLPTEAQ